MADRNHEKRVLDEFIDGLRSLGHECTDWGLVRDEPPDALGVIDGERVHIELVRYCEECYENDLWERDWALKCAFRKAMEADLELSQCSVTIQYFGDQHRKGYGIGDGSDDVWRKRGHLIPREDEHPAFIDALLEFARGRMQLGMSFNGWGGETECELLRTYCARLTVDLHPGTHVHCLMTSTGRCQATDVAGIRHTLKRKIGKVPNYRNRIGSGPLWLVYYTESQWPTRHPVGPNTADLAIDAIGSVLAIDHTRSFDCVWWFDRYNDGPLRRVDWRQRGFCTG